MARTVAALIAQARSWVSGMRMMQGFLNRATSSSTTGRITEEATMPGIRIMSVSWRRFPEVSLPSLKEIRTTLSVGAGSGSTEDTSGAMACRGMILLPRRQVGNLLKLSPVRLSPESGAMVLRG